jgi:hypothetical protein
MHSDDEPSGTRTLKWVETDLLDAVDNEFTGFPQFQIETIKTHRRTQLNGLMRAMFLSI